MSIDSFSPISGTTVDIQDLVVTADGVGAGQVQIQTLTTGGATDKTFQWIPEEEAGDYDMTGAGWFNADEWAQAEHAFEQGEGFVTVNDFGSGATITFSGEVPSGSTEISIPSLVSISGNATPVDADLQSIAVTAVGISAGQVQIQTLTSGGATDKTFQWIPAEEAGDYDMETEGWFNADEWAQAEYTVSAGEGFVLVNDFGTGATLTLPAAITE